MAEQPDSQKEMTDKRKKASTTEKALKYLMASKGMSRQEAVEKLRKIRAQRNESLEEASSTAAAASALNKKEETLNEVSKNLAMKAFSARRNKLMTSALSGDSDYESDKKKLRKIRDNIERKWAKAEKAREMKEAKALDPSGLIAAAHHSGDYFIHAEVDGKKKKFRVKGMSGPNAAKERFLKHYNQAKVLKVHHVNEEVQLDEISVDKIHKYIKSAVFDQSSSSVEARKTDDSKAKIRIDKRQKGLNKAFNKLGAKLATENKEQIDEISTDLVKKYKTVASAQKDHLEKGKENDEKNLKWYTSPYADRRDSTAIDDTKRAIKHKENFIKLRSKGLDRANKRVAEESAQLDELSPATKASYAAKAKDEVSSLKKYVKSGDGEYKDLAKNAIKRRTAGIKRATTSEEVAPALIKKYQKILMTLKGKSYPLENPEVEDDSDPVKDAVERAKTVASHSRTMNIKYARGTSMSEGLVERYLKRNS